MRTIGGGDKYPLMSANEASAPRSVVGERSAIGGAVYTMREHYRNLGWCRGLSEYTETFDSLNPAWDVSGLASATISGGKLVTQGVIGSSANTINAGALLSIPPILGDFEISCTVSWSGNGGSLYGIFFFALYSTTSPAIAQSGVNDAWVLQLGAIDARIEGVKLYDTGYGAAGESGEIAIKVTRTAGTVKIYHGDVLRAEKENVTRPVTTIALLNTRSATASYSGYTVSYDNLYVKRRR